MQPRVVATNCLAELHAARAHLGVSPASNAGADTQWYDTSGNSKHGTLSLFDYSATSGWGGTGSLADPFRVVCAGTDSIALPDLSAAEDGTFTYEAWVMTTDVTPAANHIFMAEDTSGNAPMCGLMLNGGALVFGGWASGWSPSMNITASSSIIDGLPHHVVVVGSGGQGRMYVDNVAQGGSGTSLVTMTGLNQTWVGRWGGATTGNYVGGLMVARYYSAALTVDQIAQNYAAGYLWPMDWLPGGPDVVPAKHIIKIGSVDIPVVG